MGCSRVGGGFKSPGACSGTPGAGSWTPRAPSEGRFREPFGIVSRGSRPVAGSVRLFQAVPKTRTNSENFGVGAGLGTPGPALGSLRTRPEFPGAQKFRGVSRRAGGETGGSENPELLQGTPGPVAGALGLFREPSGQFQNLRPVPGIGGPRSGNSGPVLGSPGSRVGVPGAQEFRGGLRDPWGGKGDRNESRAGSGGLGVLVLFWGVPGRFWRGPVVRRLERRVPRPRGRLRDPEAAPGASSSSGAGSGSLGGAPGIPRAVSGGRVQNRF